MLFSVQPGKSLWLFFLLLGETSTLLQVEATYRKQSRERSLQDNCPSFVIFFFFFFRRGLLTSKQRTNLHWKTNVLCYSWTYSRLFLQFRKTPFWLKQVRSHVFLPQGIFPFWARDAFLPPFSSVVTQTKIAIIFHSTRESSSLPHSLILIPTLTTSSLPSRALTQPGLQIGSK